MPNFDLNINLFFLFRTLSCVKHEKSSKKYLGNKNEKKPRQIEIVKFVKL